MKVLGLVGILLVSVACNNAAPTATGYKEQLGAPAAVTGNNTGNATGSGDAAKGQTALATCTGCHAEGGAAHKLVAADADSIGKGTAGSNPIHGSIPQAAKDAFKNNALDMAAFLKGGTASGTPAAGAGAGDAAKGAALLTGTCEAVCHGKTAGALDSFSDLTGQETAPYHPADIQKAIGDNKDDLTAALKARPQ
jgi:cytochrome c553